MSRQLGVAVNDRRRNQQTGEWEDVPNYVDCTMFGPYAQAMERRLSRGAKVAIDGRLRWSQWEADGQRRSKLEVVVEGIELMSGGGEAAAPRQQPQPAPAPIGPAPVLSASVYDDEIPF